MKPILILFIAFGIQISTLFANNIGEVITPIIPTSFFCPECPILSPKVPLEAPFSELTELYTILDLMPLVPMVAPFEGDLEVRLVANTFAPVFPLRADFDDNLINLVDDDSSLAPVPPLTAEFSDTL